MAANNNETFNLALHRPTNVPVRVLGFIEPILPNAPLKAVCRLPDETTVDYLANDLVWMIREHAEGEPKSKAERWERVLRAFNAAHEKQLVEIEEVIDQWKGGLISAQEASDKVVWAISPYLEGQAAAGRNK